MRDGSVILTKLQIKANFDSGVLFGLYKWDPPVLDGNHKCRLSSPVIRKILRREQDVDLK